MKELQSMTDNPIEDNDILDKNGLCRNIDVASG
jgi:hypothetical protein